MRSCARDQSVVRTLSLRAWTGIHALANPYTERPNLLRACKILTPPSPPSCSSSLSGSNHTLLPFLSLNTNQIPLLFLPSFSRYFSAYYSLSFSLSLRKFLSRIPHCQPEIYTVFRFWKETHQIDLPATLAFFSFLFFSLESIDERSIRRFN